MIIDHVAATDGGPFDRFFDSATVIGPDNGTLPAGVFRDKDGPNAWCLNDYLDFNAAANADRPRTPGAANVPCQPPVGPVGYCTSGTSTNFCVATMSASGAPSASASSGFVLLTSNVEGQKQGLIFYGTSGQHNAPWSSGSSSYLCVKAPTQRLPAQNSGGTNFACDGMFAADWSAYMASHPSALGQPLMAGLVVDAQAWYRDPPAAKTTNLSDGLEFTLGP